MTRGIFIISGIAATIWFLSRVIPKPSRAYYPCVQAATPVMAGFVVYLLSISGSVLVFKRFRNALSDGRYRMALVLVLLFLVLMGVSLVSYNPQVKAITYATQDDFIPNEPMGTAQGVNPGRVVWVWDNKVANHNCQQTVNKNGILDNGDDLWFMDKNTNQNFTDYMFSKSIQKLTGKVTDQESWDELFRYFNNKKGRGDQGYQTGEKIFIKTNHGSAWGNDRFDSSFGFNDKAWNAGYTETGPQLVLTVLRHLVNKVGVAQQNIFVGDPMKNIYKEYYQKWYAEFPNVRYLGNNLIVSNVPNLAAHGRTPVVRTSQNVLFFGDNTAIKDANYSQRLYTVFQVADYMINLSALKPHDHAGITLTAKNHFGSHASRDASHMHGALVKERYDYRMYRVLVDLMGHQLLGRNTLLFVVDGMWSGENNELSLPSKWTMAPFNGSYPASLFVSQDQVALESVCFDFLRTEYTVGNYSKNNPNMKGTDDYLHQAADEANWPAGVIYNPDGTGKIGSLGVHEHWNNANDMQYSRNLGTGEGIELVKVLVDNHIPLATAPIPDKIVTKTGTDMVAIEDVRTYFHDVDGDPLSFTTQSGDARLASHISGNQLILNLNTFFGEDEYTHVTLIANDGKASNSLSFRVSSDNTTGIDISQEWQKQVSIYPNPVKDQLNIRISKTGDYTFMLINNLGQIVSEKQFRGNQFQSDLSSERSGVYRVIISENNRIIFSGGIVRE